MFKILGFIVGGLILVVMFIDPVRNYMNSFFKNKTGLDEEQIIGSTSLPNPRVEEIQMVLKSASYDPGEVDGVMGAWTRKAIRNFQRDKNLRPSGKVDYKTWLELNREKEMLKKKIIPQDHVPENTAPQVSGSMREVANEELSKDKNKQIQAALRYAGFYKGEIDGKIGRRTKEAIREFQRAKGLKADGAAGARTWLELEKYLKD